MQGRKGGGCSRWCFEADDDEEEEEEDDCAEARVDGFDGGSTVAAITAGTDPTEEAVAPRPLAGAPSARDNFAAGSVLTVPPLFTLTSPSRSIIMDADWSMPSPTGPRIWRMHTGSAPLPSPRSVGLQTNWLKPWR